MRFSHKVFLAAVAVVVLPLGWRSEVDLEIARTRSCAIWWGQPVTGYKLRSPNAMTEWATKNLGLRSKNQWAVTMSGPWWSQRQKGPPKGNYVELAILQRCFQDAPDEQKTEVTALARQCLNTPDMELRAKLLKQAVDQWLGGKV